MRKRNFNLLSWSTLFVFILICVSAQAQDPLFTATVSSTRIFQNTVFEVQFELQNANGNEFHPPDFTGFRVAGGPAMGSSTVIVNGKVSRSQSWTYSLLAIAPGRFTIGQASVVAGRRILKTQPVTVDVLAAKDVTGHPGGTGGGNEAIKLIAYVKPGDYYPGQQIVLEYKLLFTENIQSVTTVSEDDYADFFIQNFNSFSKEATYETINGVAYVSRVVKAIALFAHQSGTYTIDPMVMMVGVNAPYPAEQGFFTMRRLHNFQVISEPLTIRIKPLPDDPSASEFSGAVGQYTLSTVASGPVKITTDDDFNLRIEIKGNGDARRWDPPTIAGDGNFEIYDPKIIEDKMMDVDGSVLHSRIIEYSMIPVKEGEHSIHIPFRYFDPVTKSYETIHSDTINVHVAPGNNIPRSATVDSADLRAPRELKKVSNIKTDDRFWFSIPHILFFGMLISGTFWGLLVTYKRKKDAAIPEADKLRSASARHARQQLEHLMKSDTISDQEFYESVTEVYYRFLSERFSFLPADLDSDKIKSLLVQSGVSDENIERALRFYDQCLSVRYGGRPGGYTREEMIRECKEVIDLLDARTKAHI